MSSTDDTDNIEFNTPKIDIIFAVNISHALIFSSSISCNKTYFFH